MAESINDIAIKLSVDAAGVSKGFRTAAEEARSYKAELDRLVYAVGKSDPVDYNAHVTQYTQATNERLAKEKKAQEEFNAWYRVEADREFQAWYAVELKKEQVREQQLAQERQRSINTVNSQRFQAAPEAETFGRAQQNDQLEAAIKARYALLDQEERAIRDNAANRAAAQTRANADAQRLHEQDLQNLREYITQKYAILNREEAIERMNASNAAEIARLKTMRTKQAQDAANAQRDADFVAYKADLARQEAAGMVNAERTARIERARQRDAKRAADDDRVRQLNDWRMQQAMMQRAAVDTQLATARMTGGFGGAAMAMGQASYAAEDFIQVLSMGGGLNMALMSASNNLSMVVRSLAGTSMAMSAVAGLAVPAVLIGTNMLIQYLSKEEEQISLVTKAYERLNAEREHTNTMASLQSQHAMNMADIDALTTYASAAASLASKIRALAAAEEAEAESQNKVILKRNELRDTVAGGSIIAAAEQNLAWLRKMDAEFENIDWMTIATAEDDVRHLTEAYKDLAEAIATGTADRITQAAEDYKAAIDATKSVFNATPIAPNGELSPILGSEEDTKVLKETIGLLRELQNAELATSNSAKEKAEAQQKTNELLEKEKQIRQENMLFQLQATDAQKAEMDIRKQLTEFLGFTNTEPEDLSLETLLGQEKFDAQDFMAAYIANLEQSKQDMLEEQRRSTPTGGTEQNAFSAQASALQQMLEAQYKQEDPQLRDIDNRIQQSNELLRQITDGPALLRVP